LNRKNQLFVSPTLKQSFDNSPYGDEWAAYSENNITTTIGSDNSPSRRLRSKDRKRQNPRRKNKNRKQNLDSTTRNGGTTKQSTDEDAIAELTAVYMGMIEEIDYYVGQMLDELESSGLDSTTLVVFTSDHGELVRAANGEITMSACFPMLSISLLVSIRFVSFSKSHQLGAHGGLLGKVRRRILEEPSSPNSKGQRCLMYLNISASFFFTKGVLLEEAVRVPLILSMPGTIPPATVRTPVSQINLFSTILQYLDASSFDRSDGFSLTKYIEGTSYNDMYDESVVVSEIEKSYEDPGTDIPNFMIRSRNWKLIMPRMAESTVPDMLFNLRIDPYETTNLLESRGKVKTIISKAEHLKCLLVEWMKRVDGPFRFYSDR